MQYLGSDTILVLRSLACRRAAFVFLLATLFSVSAEAQSPERDAPVIVQPGAPGQPTRILPPSTTGVLPPISRKDIEFMQGMIMHHAQAVEMTDLIEARTTNRNIRVLGARISRAQEDEINFMKRWLAVRGESAEMPASHNHGGHAHGRHTPPQQHLMPGMLSDAQMKALRGAKGAEFDRLFLEGMIQHHDGALVMVKELFESPGSGQDPELFNFATDVDTSQRAEIKIMQNLLEKLTV
jgi:uncharacterized protein (DUF305 family)